MSGQLPTPIKTELLAGAKLSVYLAKDFFKSEWSSKKALKILKQARRSYLRYGNVPLLDKYDRKSLIYLVRAEYKVKIDKKTLPVEEWLSVRFVPGYGKPLLTEDFAHCIANNKPLKYLFKKKLFPETKNFSRHIATLSRLCKIPPKILDSNWSQTIPGLKKNKYTLHSFCLANQAFLEHKYSRDNFFYMTALFRNEVLKKSLSLNSKIFLEFQEGHKALDLKYPQSVKIKRYPFIYDYPGYFLDSEDIFKLLNKLIAQGQITHKTIAYYTKNKNWKGFPSHNNSLRTQHLGRLFTERGKLKFSPLHSQKLRELASKEIKDGPQLKITPFKQWGETIQHTLSLL